MNASESVVLAAHRDRPVAHTDSARVAPAPPPARNVALDFTKGALVVIMVAYHTLNYFRYDIRILRHLHFLPTSFIFIAGFLITHVYLPKIRSGDRGVYQRLLVRGLKTLVLFVGLNLCVHTLFQSSYNRRLGLEVLGSNVEAMFLTGEQRASVFGVLLPISYLLLLAAGLLRTTRGTPSAVWISAPVMFFGCSFLALHGALTFNLDLLSMGVLGMAAGLCPMAWLDRCSRYLMAIALTYLAYSIAIHTWYPTYLINTLGVTLSLLLLYALGRKISARNGSARIITLLGNYSLLSYLIQIAVLQGLFRFSRATGIFEGDLVLPFVCTIVLTIAAVWITDVARKGFSTVDRLYHLVFA